MKGLLITLMSLALFGPNLATAEDGQLTVEEESESLTKIHTSMTGIVDLLAKVSNSLTPKLPTTCNNSIGDLQNANSDWNEHAIYGHKDQVVIRCAKGYMSKQRLTVQTVTCHLGNQWSIFQPCSEKKVCTKPIRDIENAQHDWVPRGLYAEGDSFTVRCDPDFHLKSKEIEQEVACLQDDKWSDIEPCISKCPAPFVKHKSVCMFTDSGRSHSWDRSLELCQEMNPDYGSTLPMAHTAETQEDMVDYYTNVEKGSFTVWIGIHDKDTEGTYTWVDKQPLDLLYSGLKWESGQPNNYDGIQDCTALQLERSYVELADYECSSNYYLTCQIPL